LWPDFVVHFALMPSAGPTSKPPAASGELVREFRQEQALFFLLAHWR
jgi:hypothetical protein